MTFTRRIQATPVQFAVAFLLILQGVALILSPDSPHHHYWDFVYWGAVISGAMVSAGRLADNGHRTWALELESAGDILVVGVFAWLALMIIPLEPSLIDTISGLSGYVGLAVGFLVRWRVVRKALSIINHQ